MKDIRRVVNNANKLKIAIDLTMIRTDTPRPIPIRKES